jgi:mannose-6-phosphate isomerase-like protein (cupin superfamily)
MGYSFVDVEELPGEGPGGAVRFTRKALGARAFGFNHITLPANATGHEHDETGSNQEEVYVVLGGSGRMRIDGDEVELKPGRLLRIDPGSTRCPTAGEAGLTFITFGAPVGGSYEPPPGG